MATTTTFFFFNGSHHHHPPPHSSSSSSMAVINGSHHPPPPTTTFFFFFHGASSAAAMAVSVPRSSTSTLPHNIFGQSSPFSSKTDLIFNLNYRWNRRRVSYPRLSVFHDDSYDLQWLVESEKRQLSDNDPTRLPRPLTTTDIALNNNNKGLRVAYQGFPGAYSESAALKAYPDCKTIPCEQFDSAFEAVENCIVDRAVLPIENSCGGSIHRNYDLLLEHQLYIVGEVRYAVRHCLLANHGVKIEDIKMVHSHPQALAQCDRSLRKKLKLNSALRVPMDDTAGSAKHIAEHKLTEAAAIASSVCARMYGLDILAEDIQDDPGNVTRFLMLAREPIIAHFDRPFKTSIVFSLEEGPGILFKALAVFAFRNINLTKVESRPVPEHPLRGSDGLSKFQYIFYLDFEASMADKSAQNALRHLKEFAKFLRVLGSFPAEDV